MKARTETGEQQPFNYEPTRKLCKGCHEPCIVNAAGYCDDCEHVRKLQTLANSIVQLGNGGSVEDRANFFDEMYKAAAPLARIDT